MRSIFFLILLTNVKLPKLDIIFTKLMAQKKEYVYGVNWVGRQKLCMCTLDGGKQRNATHIICSSFLIF